MLAQVQVGHIMVEGRKPALLDSFFQVSYAPRWPAGDCPKRLVCFWAGPASGAACGL